MTPTRAIVRSIPDSFASAITMIDKPAPTDVANARRQHERYVEALAGAGLEIVRLTADERFPDCCFVEDCALLGAGTALVTRPGAASRQGEELAVRNALEATMAIATTEAPATLDGGDCMRVGQRIFVGRSARTNEAGIARVRAVFEPFDFEVIAIPLHDVLHLKCVCSPLDDATILLAEGTLPRDLFAGLTIIDVPAAESLAANAVAIGRTIVVADGFAQTARAIASAGYTVVTVDTSEIRKADGALTCLSVLF